MISSSMLPTSRPIKGILVPLTAGLTLSMTAMGLLAPVVPRRLDELGSGVAVLSMMSATYALAQLLSAPLAGRLSDRNGRRPVILVALLAYVVAAAGFALAEQVVVFVVVYGLIGALTAGLFPAATAVVADIVPDDERERWIGFMTASYAVGFLIGPVVGGVVADGSSNRHAAVLASAVAAVGLLVAARSVPETKRGPRPTPIESARETRPAGTVRNLLVVDFLVMFAFGFVAPQLVYFAYDEAGLSTTQYGIVVAGSALGMAIGQTLLSGVPKVVGREATVVGGLAVYSATFAAYIPFHSAFAIMLIAGIAGLAYGLVGPALTTAYLDRTDPKSHTSMLGIRTSTMAAGGIAGPVLLATTSDWLSATTVFTITSALLALATLTAALAMRAPVKQHCPLADCGPVVALVTTNLPRLQHNRRRPSETTSR